MTSDDRDRERLARLEAQTEDQRDRIKSLEGNQKWAVVTILGLVIKTIFDFISKGQP
jgi:hypothetical protein